MKKILLKKHKGKFKKIITTIALKGFKQYFPSWQYKMGIVKNPISLGLTLKCLKEFTL